MAKKAPNPIDKHIGARIRMRRMMLGISQEKLGEALGLTFQQVQKYEKGANRVGGSRMQQIATVLQVPVGWFYEGAPGGTVAIAPASDFTTTFLADRQGLAIARAFVAITSPEQRNAIVAMVQACVPGAAKHKAA